ncbi:MAG: glutathione S-transferase family protein [Candidatus Puniceispirillaceae bacterium]
MLTLFHHALSAGSRLIRLQLAEHQLDFDLKTQVPWQRDERFLAMNPAGSLPVLALDSDYRQTLCGVRAISEWVEEQALGNAFAQQDRTPASNLLGEQMLVRAETRRLIDWFEDKFQQEVSGPLIRERIIKRFSGNKPVNSDVIRAALVNAQTHVGYINFLAERSPWLAGDSLSLADFAAAAQISILDYFGDVDWERIPDARLWYMKIKSRPCFRALLADQIVGVTPSASYANLDF